MGCAFDHPKCSISYCKKKQSEDFTNFFQVKAPEVDLPQLVLQTQEDVNSQSNLKNSIKALKKSVQYKQRVDLSLGNKSDLIPPPVLKLFIYSTYTLHLLCTVSLTPNSIQLNNDPIKIKPLPVKFTFGKDAMNDCVLDDESIGLDQFHIIHQHHKYYIIDNHKGTGLFCKITGKKVIDHDLRICFGADFMVIKVRPNSAGEKDIHIKFYQKKELERTYSSNSKHLITIGRNKKCDICYQEESVSKVQCTMLFVKDNWIIIDGAYEKSKQKCSTNGIWLLASKGIEIKKDMVFKTGALKITVDNDTTTESGDDTNYLHYNNSSIMKDEENEVMTIK